MADNVDAPATGATFATDQIGTVHYPKNKLVFGPNDTATDVRDDQPLPIRPRTTGAGNTSAQTPAAGGAAFTAFASQACHEMIIVNDTGVTIEVQQGGAGAVVPVFDKTAFPFSGLTNANQLGVRRKDGAITQVTVAARWNA